MEPGIDSIPDNSAAPPEQPRVSTWRKVKTTVPPVWRWSWRIFTVLFIAQFGYIILLKWVNPPITITQLNSWLYGNGLSRDYVSWNEVSPHVKLAVIAAEDQLFPYHNGFDWKSIQKAIKNNQKNTKRVRGASTISQQVAKNVFLWQGRSWLRKGMEAYFTFMIEAVWGKQRILECYLNVAEMGKGVFGIEMAAKKYFRKPAKKLTRDEAAMIAAMLPNPKKYSIKPMSRYITARYPWVMSQMNNLELDVEVNKLLK